MRIFTFIAIAGSCSATALAGQDLPIGALDFSQASAILEDFNIDVVEKFEFCCHRPDPENHTKLISFEASDSWFVIVTTDLFEIQRANMVGSCRSIFSVRDCSVAEIQSAYEESIVTYRGFPGWYGKYHNRIIATSDGIEIPRVDKFMRQNLILLERSNGQDTLMIGPMVIQPDKIDLSFDSGQIIALFES